ncbi:arginyl-tRNA synthetase [Pseudovirgaria hyperparasitica]|uniref:arginine--tRNA ligase n=1 Tax=Pseudovirgaria hyperparasitica TaxID=470096 RepID=A0A6A6W7T4_9PEZI|nr:arginyl-tRNA synthetase [Pseudovirgaria hyperparasitica]KAF2758922.1 arginyl-tRNA synthetase [Pseudovirgaria hyperparasitica]
MEASQNTPAQSIDELASILQGVGVSEVPKMPNTYPELNPFDVYRAHITELLASICDVEKSIILAAMQWTTTLEKGDLQLPVPALRKKGVKPDALAKELAEKFPESVLVERPTVVGVSLAFFFKTSPLTKLIVPFVLKNGAKCGFNPNFGLRDPTDPSKGKKKMIVEFSSPNIAKPFHAGHLRSTIIGGFLANLYEGAGWDVTRMNYLGDWGKQYGVLAVGFDKFGSEAELVKNPIGHLYEVYVKISAISREEKEVMDAKEEEIKKLQEAKEPTGEKEAELQALIDKGVDEQARKYFKRMVDGDSEALGVWKRFRDLSIVKYKDTYARLNIRYDEYSGESQVQDASMDEAAKILEEKGISHVDRGAVLVDLSKHQKKLGKCLVKKKDGTSLYLTRDIGAATERFEKYHFDKMIYVVANQQDLHLAQLFKIMELMGRTDISSRCEHINFGMVLGMSTRKGTARFLDDILRDVGDKMHEVMRGNADKYAEVEDPHKTADTLGISAVMVQDMKGKRVNNYEFNMDRMCSFEGDTGPYLQYAHARITSITRKAPLSLEELLSADLSLLTEPKAMDLVRTLACWPDVFVNTVKTQEPTTVLTYLFKMVHTLSSSYEVLKVVGSEEELKKARAALLVAAKQVLGNGMRLLGLSPVERM